jgi:ABC-type cobalamin/Fe3+-siderophores transport systems, ATPase components
MAEPLLKVAGLNFYYRSTQALFDIDLHLFAGQYLSVIGPNGSGKSTLLRLLCGQEVPASGAILLEGEELRSLPVAARAKRCAVVFQNERAQFPFTCMELITMGLHPFRSRFGAPSPQQMQLVCNTMRQADVWHLRDRPATQVSGGEYQRVMLARAIVQTPKLLLLDEAMSDLDVGAKLEMTAYLRQLAARNNMAIVAVNHDLSLAYRQSDTLLVLQRGRVAAFGSPQEVMTESLFRSVFGVEADIVPDKGFFINQSINQKEYDV